MLVKGFLAWLGGSRAPKTPRDAAEPPPAALDLDRLLAANGRAARIERAVGLLPTLGPERSRALVEGVVRTFASYVVDLPAAEEFHHAEPFGLLDHSLEVAEHALRASQSEYFVADTQAYPEKQEHRVPRLRYASWFCSLIHDAGKINQVQIRGPGYATWNPYEEPLLAFYARHGRENCRLDWKSGRGLDAHNWHTAYLLARLITPPVAAYLGESILSEVLEQKTDAARKIEELKSLADQRSTQDDLARQVRRDQDARAAERPAPPLFVAVPDYIERLPEIVGRAIAERVLRVNDLAGELFVGRKYLLLKYPAALAKLAILVKETIGRENAQARALDGTEDGARALAHYLHKHRKLFYDRETDGWKLKVTVGEHGRHDVLAGVLLDRRFVDFALARAGTVAPFEGAVSIARWVDGLPLAVDDFKTLVSPADRPEGRTPSAAAVASAPAPTPVAEPAPPPIPIPSPVGPSPGLRRFISAEVLFEDIRNAILAGWIPTNVWNGQVYVLPDVTYFASPRGFQKLVEKGLYNRDPKSEVSAYLDALAKLPAVRKFEGGRILARIAIRPGARPLWVLVFETRGLFKSETDLARVGTWTESPIRILTEEEALAAIAEGKKREEPPPAAALVGVPSA